MNALQQYCAGSEIDTAFCRQKAEECVTLSYEIADPKGQVAVLKLANWWMRLAENYLSLSKIRSGRIGDAIRPRLAGTECARRPGQRAVSAHPCSVISVCAPR